MAASFLQAPALYNPPPATFTVSAGANRKVVVAAIYGHGSDAAPVTSVTLGGQSLTQVSVVDAAGHNMAASIFEANESVISAMSGNTLTLTGGTYENSQNGCIIFTVQDTDQGSTVLNGAAVNAASGTVSLARAASSVTFGFTASTWASGGQYTLAEPAEDAEADVGSPAYGISYGSETDTARTVNCSWTCVATRDNVTFVANYGPVTAGSSAPYIALTPQRLIRRTAR